MKWDGSSNTEQPSLPFPFGESKKVPDLSYAKSLVPPFSMIDSRTAIKEKKKKDISLHPSIMDKELGAIVSVPTDSPPLRPLSQFHSKPDKKPSHPLPPLSKLNNCHL